MHDRASFIRHEIGQQPEFRRRQPHRLSSHRDDVAAEVDVQDAIVISRRRFLFARRTAQQSLYAQPQLLHAEWLSEIVVGAQFQALE